MLPRATPTRTTGVYLNSNLSGSHKTSSRHPPTNKYMDDRRTSPHNAHTNSRRESAGNLLVTLHDKTIKLWRSSPSHHSSHQDTNSSTFQINYLGMETRHKSLCNPPYGGRPTHKRCHELAQADIWKNLDERISNNVPFGAMIATSPTSNRTYQKTGSSGPTPEKTSHVLQRNHTHNQQWCKRCGPIFHTSNQRRGYPMDIKKSTNATCPPRPRRMFLYHVIDWNQNGSGIMVVMLPNVALYSSTMVWHLLLFTKWIWEPTLGHSQAQKVATAFMAETITWQMTWKWDPVNNCVLQADSTLIGRVLNDFLLYNLTATTQLSTTVTTTAQSIKPQPAAQAQSEWQIPNAAHTTNDLDSLSNSTLSQGTWFTTTTTQLDAKTSWKHRLPPNSQPS